MNLVDSNVHVDVIGVMADDAHSLVFSVAQLAVEPLLDESQSLYDCDTPVCRGKRPEDH